LPFYLGEVVSLTTLGCSTEATVLSRSWSPALGEVVQFRGERHGQPCCVLVLYGEQLDGLLTA
jgi:hypothetical protein